MKIALVLISFIAVPFLVYFRAWVINQYLIDMFEITTITTVLIFAALYIKTLVFLDVSEQEPDDDILFRAFSVALIVPAVSWVILQAIN